MRILLRVVIILFLCSSCFGINLEPNCVAHYKMNENTAEGGELVNSGDFTTWVVDNPDPTYWLLVGESGNDPECSEAGTGEAHANTPTLGGGMCNIYTSDGSNIYIQQTVTVVIGRKYRFSMNIDTVTEGTISVAGLFGSDRLYSTTGIKTFTFVATDTSEPLTIKRLFGGGACDVTFDDVSIKLYAAFEVEDSSGNGHDGLLQEDTNTVHVTGKINGAFDFDGSSDYLEIADSNDFSFGDGTDDSPFSISMWIYMDVATTFPLVAKYAAGQYEWVFRVHSDAKLYMILYSELDVNKARGRYYNTALSTGQWYHVIATYNGVGGVSADEGVKLYIDGVKKDDSRYSTGVYAAMDDGTQTVQVARRAALYSNGQIDNVAIFNKELSQTEVDFLYNGGNGREILKSEHFRKGTYDFGNGTGFKKGSRDF